jgi:hypothetical protein
MEIARRDDQSLRHLAKGRSRAIGSNREWAGGEFRLLSLL